LQNSENNIIFEIMPDSSIPGLVLATSVDPTADLLIIEDVNANETKKTTPNILKTSLSLENVSNTSDLNKPISTATQTALNLKQDTITLTTTGTSGAATLISNTLNIPNYEGGGGGVTDGDKGDITVICKWCNLDN
jgi:hypothetical protein